MKIREMMTKGTRFVSPQTPVIEAAGLMRVVALMQQYQVRRLPVLDRDSKLVGIVSLGDIAVDVHAGLSGKVLKDVSEPAVPLL